MTDLLSSGHFSGAKDDKMVLKIITILHFLLYLPFFVLIRRWVCLCYVHRFVTCVAGLERGGQGEKLVVSEKRSRK